MDSWELLAVFSEPKNKFVSDCSLFYDVHHKTFPTNWWIVSDWSSITEDHHRTGEDTRAPYTVQTRRWSNMCNIICSTLLYTAEPIISGVVRIVIHSIIWTDMARNLVKLAGTVAYETISYPSQFWLLIVAQTLNRKIWPWRDIKYTLYYRLVLHVLYRVNERND